jgi:hypothetical protein
MVHTYKVKYVVYEWSFRTGMLVTFVGHDLHYKLLVHAKFDHNVLTEIIAKNQKGKFLMFDHVHKDTSGTIGTFGGFVAFSICSNVVEHYFAK